MMSFKFGIANSVCQMRCSIMDYFDNLLLWSFFTFYISSSVANELHMYRLFAHKIVVFCMQLCWVVIRVTFTKLVVRACLLMHRQCYLS